MNEAQEKLWKQILDLNWQIAMSKKITTPEDYAPVRKLKSELRESMGADAYDKFMNAGKELFAPVVD